MNKDKPLGIKSYGSIGHLPNSRMGPADRKITEGQERIATVKARDRHDRIIVTEKLDGSNVGICKVNGEIVALGRAGYAARTSPHEQHHLFADWVDQRAGKFHNLLNEGERICGEWLAMAHGTIYELGPRDPFVMFDMFDSSNKRKLWDEIVSAGLNFDITLPFCVNDGKPISVNSAMSILGSRGRYGALEDIEGVVYRVERKGLVDYLCKWVRPDKIDGKYFSDSPTWNWTP